MGMKTINLSVQHPTIKEMVTIASMDFEQENTETLCEFWRQLNEVSFFYCHRMCAVMYYIVMLHNDVISHKFKNKPLQSLDEFINFLFPENLLSNFENLKIWLQNLKKGNVIRKNNGIDTGLIWDATLTAHLVVLWPFCCFQCF